MIVGCNIWTPSKMMSGECQDGSTLVTYDWLTEGMTWIIFINTEGYVIPSLEIEDSGENNSDFVEVEESKKSSAELKKEENIYLGPHGAPPSQSKQQELNSANNRKQKFRQKLKEADEKYSGSGRENKVEHLRELVGGKMPAGSKGSPREWLEPHCDENMFERRHRK